MSNLDQPSPSGAFIEISGPDLVFRHVSVFDDTPTGSQILGYSDLSPREDYIVLQWLPQGDIEELRPDETMDLRAVTPARFIIAKTDRLFRFVLNDRSLAWPRNSIPVSALRILGNIEPAAQLYVVREKQKDELLADDAVLALGEAGVEKVYSKHESWKINVQGVEVVSAEPLILVRTALSEAGFNPDQGWIIVLKTSESKRQVSLDDTIDLRTPGIEKLRLTPREINNGEAGGAVATRREFRLLPGDEAGLDARGVIWETFVDAGHRWLVLHDYALPAGYSAETATVALDIPSAYPMAEIDMFFCLPHLTRSNGGTIPQADVAMIIAGHNYQRWSRHRGQGSRWQPGVDNVLTHLALVESALAREVEQ